MGLDSLLCKLENRLAVTPVTPSKSTGVTAGPLPHKACTPVTPVTPIFEDTGEEAREAGADPGPCWRWLLRYPDGTLDELDTIPPATAAEVLARYPSALVEPIDTATLLKQVENRP